MKRAILILLFLGLGFVSEAYANGLSTPFGEVKLEELETGKRYSFQELVGQPFSVENTSATETIDLRVEVLVPQSSELKPGFEAIPEASWIELEDSEFQVNPKERASTDLTITIPSEPALKGRKFQLYLWAHTVGQSVGVGLRCRFMLTLSSNKPEED